jgi:hypothetical protein
MILIWRLNLKLSKSSETPCEAKVLPPTGSTPSHSLLFLSTPSSHSYPTFPCSRTGTFCTISLFGQSLLKEKWLHALQFLRAASGSQSLQPFSPLPNTTLAFLLPPILLTYLRRLLPSTPVPLGAGTFVRLANAPS